MTVVVVVVAAAVIAVVASFTTECVLSFFVLLSFLLSPALLIVLLLHVPVLSLVEPTIKPVLSKSTMDSRSLRSVFFCAGPTQEVCQSNRDGNKSAAKRKNGQVSTGERGTQEAIKGNNGCV